jgi:hypothetical protein
VPRRETEGFTAMPRVPQIRRLAGRRLLAGGIAALALAGTLSGSVQPPLAQAATTQPV